MTSGRRWSLRLAAEQGHAGASYRLGAVAQAGGHLGSAVAHFEKAADGGHAEAQLRLGEMLEGGEGTAQDTARAMHYYRSAMARGGGRTEHVAANNLAELLVAEAVRAEAALTCVGGIIARGTEAQRCFESAAGAGVVDAQYNLGQMRLVEGDAEGAAVWLRQAAECQHVEAAHSLATLYRSGRLTVGPAGSHGADEEATRFYRIAAQSGLDAAQYALAWRLFRGEGADRSLPESPGWFAALQSRDMWMPRRRSKTSKSSELCSSSSSHCRPRLSHQSPRHGVSTWRKTTAVRTKMVLETRSRGIH